MENNQDYFNAIDEQISDSLFDPEPKVESDKVMIWETREMPILRVVWQKDKEQVFYAVGNFAISTPVVCNNELYARRFLTWERGLWIQDAMKICAIALQALQDVNAESQENKQ